jgi:prepilin-type N-terminal cleavage/methylation domain-containing protein/prepilin-type processing-associated H-X9-DG protein
VIVLRCIGNRRGFTLVELLVVIGIIAILMGILIPALSRARAQADATKCASALRQIGNAFLMYAQEERGYFPPARTFGLPYRISFPTARPPIDSSGNQYWFVFLAKYLTKGKMGVSVNDSESALVAQLSVLWGCPAYFRYIGSAASGGVNQLQPGYGMNAWPEYTASFPPIAGPPNCIGNSGFNPTQAPNAVATPTGSTNWTVLLNGKWYKLKAWTSPSNRALVADARYWVCEAQAAPLNGVIPGQQIPSSSAGGATWASPTTNGQTLHDFYRHGKYPPVAVPDPSGSGNGYYSSVGGRVSYNVLFADGHVSTLNDRAEGYRAIRMRFPG